MKNPNKFKSKTGLMGATESGQRVTADNIASLPPGSVIRNGDGSRIIHLHDEVWLRCSECSWVYDGVSRMRTYLDKDSVLCHIP